MIYRLRYMCYPYRTEIILLQHEKSFSKEEFENMIDNVKYVHEDDDETSFYPFEDCDRDYDEDGYRKRNMNEVADELCDKYNFYYVIADVTYDYD